MSKWFIKKVLLGKDCKGVEQGGGKKLSKDVVSGKAPVSAWSYRKLQHVSPTSEFSLTQGRVAGLSYSLAKFHSGGYKLPGTSWFLLVMWAEKLQEPKDSHAVMFAGVGLKATAHRAEGWEHRDGKMDLRNCQELLEWRVNH